MAFQVRTLIAGGIAALAGLFSGAAVAFPIATGGEGFEVVVGSTGNVVATYQGNSAAYSNNLYLVTNDGVAGNDIFIFNNHLSAVGATVDLGSFSAGTVLVFRLHVNNTGYDFFTGDAARNPDGHAHARVQQDWMPDETLVSFEDLYNGAFQFNDLSFSFSNTTSAPAQDVPEPVSLALLGLGLAGLGFARRRRTA